MKNLYTFILAVLITANMFAQTPQKLTYQAVIRNSSNQLIVSQIVGMRISILQGSATGTAVYVETQSPKTNSNGLLTLEIGNGTVVFGTFASIDWSSGPYFIKTETDPLGGTSYTISGASQILSVPYALFAKTAESIVGGITETDPIFISSPASGISSSTISNWNSAYSWGNHANVGYLKSFTETDPLFTASPAKGITLIKIEKWDSAYTWGNHASVGYLTSYAETDPVFDASPAKGITSIKIGKWDTAYNWGNHANVGYLTSYAETDPFFKSSPSNGITKVNITNWDSAYSWGNHSSQGYLKNFTESDPIWTNASLNYYTKTNMQTSGASQLHFNNLTNTPTTVAGFGITDALTTNGNQTITGNKTFSGTTTVITPVNATDAANKAYVDALISEIEELQIASGLRIKDIDGNLYKFVTIGSQVWMAENLRTTKYNDGTPIPNVTDNTTWAALATGAYCDYNNTPANSTTYGRLYNWYSVDNNAATMEVSNGGKNVCPTGWHIPSDAEWTILTDYLTNNGYGYEGSGSDIAKSMAATSRWTAYGTLGTVGNDQTSNNNSGFTALPSGERVPGPSFVGIGDIGIWWSSSQPNSLVYIRYINYNSNNVFKYALHKEYGISVRCLRD